MNRNKIVHALETESSFRPNQKSRRLILIVWLFVAIVVFTLALTYYTIDVLSSARAYVGGEGLWSKAQKDMVYMLARYVRYHEMSSYQAFQKSLEVIHGDRAARFELERENPDISIAYAGFLNGRNDPEDIHGMIRLFRNFRRLPELDKAIDIWSRADDQIDKLVKVAGQVHAEVQSGTLNEYSSQRYLEEVFQINQQLRPLEDDFSYTLGTATREAQALLLVVLFGVISVLVILAFMFSRRLVRQNESVQHVLQEGEKQLRELMQFAPLSIVIIRLADQAILYANDHAMRQFKFTNASIESLIARRFFLDDVELDKFVRALREKASLNNWEVQLQDTDGSPIWTLLSAQRIYYKLQDCAFTTLSNINERKRLQEELRHRAFFDELTGLPNRAMFMETLNNMVGKAARQRDIVFAVLFIDLDRFKIINDDLGHDIGDRLLQQVAQRLKSSVRSTDFVSRLGGDEFVVLIDECTDTDLVIQTAQKIVDAAAPDYHIDSFRVNVTTSVGISCYPSDGTDCMTLLKNADVAMYRAKEVGRNNFQIYGGLHAE